MLRFLMALAAVAMVPHPALAQDAAQSDAVVSDRAEHILAAMRGEIGYREVFAESFRNAIPEDRFLGITEQLERQFGAMVGLESVAPTSPVSAAIRIRFERAIASGSYQLESAAPYRVTGFVISNVEPLNDSPEALVADLEALPGITSLLVTPLDNGEALIAHNPATSMALGSTFKLYVLSALARSIAAGEHAWDEVFPLTSRSFPSGQMHAWPDNAPVTLQTLATLMISTSDNTATDQLIAVLGRDAVEAEVVASGHSDPATTLPFMTTRELFLLKSGASGDLEAYRAADLDGRRAALAALAGQTRGDDAVMAAFTGGPNAIDLEWFATAEDIARIFARLRDVDDRTVLDILAVNPSLPDAAAENWSYAGYKGGSEPGVLNLSWLLQDRAGVWHVVAIGWNNPEATVDQQRLELLAMRAIALAAGN